MLMSFAFVPFYIYYLGLEAYGLIGFFATLLAVFSFLDLGLPTALNRELARRSSSSVDHGTMRTVVRTLELVYGGIGLIIGGLVFALAAPIVSYWLNTATLSAAQAETAIRLMGVVIALQWPTGLYSGGLLGLQKQVIANVILAGVTTLRGLGAILVLAFIDSTIAAFFAYQAFVSLAAVVVSRSILTSYLPPGKARFEIGVFKAVWRFAAGMMGVSVTTIILMQTDKIILSGVLPLEEYSQYVLA
jgi:O-antigen/teichoic acid export membrane protein